MVCITKLKEDPKNWIRVKVIWKSPLKNNVFNIDVKDRSGNELDIAFFNDLEGDLKEQWYDKIQETKWYRFYSLKIAKGKRELSHNQDDIKAVFQNHSKMDRQEQDDESETEDDTADMSISKIQDQQEQQYTSLYSLTYCNKNKNNDKCINILGIVIYINDEEIFHIYDNNQRTICDIKQKEINVIDDSEVITKILFQNKDIEAIKDTQLFDCVLFTNICFKADSNGQLTAFPTSSTRILKEQKNNDNSISLKKWFEINKKSIIQWSNNLYIRNKSEKNIKKRRLNVDARGIARGKCSSHPYECLFYEFDQISNKCAYCSCPSIDHINLSHT